MNLDKYIGLNYKNLGRAFSGVDCFGLVHLIYENEVGVTLPNFTELKYSDKWYKDGKNIIIENVWEDWYEVDTPRKLDGLLFYSNYRKQIVNHIGVCINSNQFIHILEKKTSTIDKIEGRWGALLYKILRYRTD